MATTKKKETLNITKLSTHKFVIARYKFLQHTIVIDSNNDLHLRYLLDVFLTSSMANHVLLLCHVTFRLISHFVYKFVIIFHIIFVQFSIKYSTMATPEKSDGPAYASFFGSMGSASAIIFTGTAE